MYKLPTPTVSFLSFPMDKTSIRTRTRTDTPNCFYSGVSVVHSDYALKFANVTHHGGHASGALKPSNGFTITCHTLVLGGSMEWEEDYTVTSDDLGDSDCLQRGTLMFPRVDIESLHVVHFLFVGSGANKSMWVVSVDMSIKTVESSHLYMNRTECFQNGYAYFFVRKSTSPMPFLPCEFPRFCASEKGREAHHDC
ncbi:unnamed protein product [Urochloa humidicola]